VRKRLVLLWMPVVLGLAMMLPATTAAATYGNIKTVSTFCSGYHYHTVNATFKLTKYSGFHATRLAMTIKGQAYYSGGWHTELNIGTYYVNINTNGAWYFKDSFYFKPGDNFSSHRILAIGNIWNYSSLVASGRAVSDIC